MEQSYVIGNYRCRSKEEYDSIISDLKKITLIKKKYDCNNPQVALKLLKFFKENPNTFTSVLGTKFIESLKKIILESQKEKYLSNVPEKIVSSDEKKEATVVTSSNGVVAKAKKKENVDDLSEYYIPLNIPAYKPKNTLYALILSCFVALIPFVTSLDLSEFWGSSVDSASSVSPNTMFVFIPLIFWMFIIGISEFSRIDKIGKEVARIKRELEKEENESDKQVWSEILIAIGFVILLVVLMVVFPPLILILMFVKACMSAAPKLKWLKANAKYIFYGFLFYGYLSFMATYVTSEDMQSYITIIESYTPHSAIIVSIVYFIITYFIFGVLMRKNTYQTLRTISTVPIMIFMILLPFALVGVAAYAMYGEDSSSSEAAPVGVHEVEGHLRHLSNGTIVYVRPHLRTNPDGILSNNFSYNG